MNDEIPLICDPVPSNLCVLRRHYLVNLDTDDETLIAEIWELPPGIKQEWPDAEFCAA